jgi:diguanylate cyclase (GGDEF)-like protein
MAGRGVPILERTDGARLTGLGNDGYSSSLMPDTTRRDDAPTHLDRTGLLPDESNDKLAALVGMFFGHTSGTGANPFRAWVSAFPLSSIGVALAFDDVATAGAIGLPSGLTQHAAAGAFAIVPIRDSSGAVVEDDREDDIGLALCVSSPTPRKWVTAELDALAAVANIAAVEIQLRAGLSKYEGAVDKLRQHPLHDLVTELANRELFLDRISQALLRCARSPERHMAVLSLRVNQLAGIETGFGYDAAQEVLKECAARLRVAVRNVDSVARLSGDEFGILLESLRDDADSARVATRIHDALRVPIVTSWDQFMVSVSIGVVLSTTGMDSPARLVQLAGLAQERAKGTGAAFELFDPGMQRKAQTRLQHETELRRGVEAGEFELHYQPIISLETGRVVEVEALVRWRHPTRGLVPAAEFIGVAEETGIIVPMGWLALTEACEQIRSWRAENGFQGHLSVSINMTAAHLRHRELIERMVAALKAAGLTDRALNFEITEGILIDDPERAKKVLNELRALGVGVHLDDFGTGYSSLQYLHELPLDAIKIDRRFIARMGRNSPEAPVAATIRELARNIGVPVIAEGVETPEQLALVRGLGCEFAQGYLFSHPLPPDGISELLSSNPSW